MHRPTSWYDSPLDRVSGDAAHRRVAEGSTRNRVDPYVTGLAHALAVGAGRVPLIP
jgi:hypothetical protein